MASFGRLMKKTEMEEVQLNVAALTHLCRLFLPDMIARKSGKIMNVGSLAGYFPGPLMSVYYATKAYVLSLSIALNEELKGTGVHVTTLCPGPTETNFFHRAQGSVSQVLKGKKMTAEEVAKIGYEALNRKQAVVVAGKMNAFQATVGSLLPKTLVAKVIAVLQRGMLPR